MRRPLHAARAAAMLAALALLAACNDGPEVEDADAGTTEQATTETTVDADEAGTPAMQDLLGTLETDPDYSTMVSAISASGLAKGLSADGKVTLFAPSNAAFDKLSEARIEELQKGELRRVLSAHIVTKRLDSATIGKAIEKGEGVAKFTTLGRGIVEARMKGDKIQLTAPGGNRALIDKADMDATNGVVHGIDTVLQPPEIEEKPADEGEKASGETSKKPKVN